MNRTDRLMAYLVIFQSRSLVRAQDLAERFEISERTVYRDIDALAQIGVPVYGVAGEGYRLMDGYYLPPVTFTPEEARSLALGLSMFMGFSVDGGAKDSAETAYEKVRTVLPARQKREIEALQAVVDLYAFPQPQLDFDDQQFLDFQRAIQDKNPIQIDYYSLSGNELTTRIVEPAGLALLNRTWQMTGWCRLRKGQRNFNLDRVDSYQILDETFEPRKMVTRSFPTDRFEIEVLFNHNIVRWVREQQHFSYVRDEAATKAGIAMVYKVASWDVIRMWLLGWGDQMQIVAPHNLRNQLAEMAQRMVDQHQSTNEKLV